MSRWSCNARGLLRLSTCCQESWLTEGRTGPSRKLSENAEIFMIYWFFFSFSAGLLLSKAVTFAEARLLRFFRPQGATPGTQSGCLPSGHSRAEGCPQPLAPPRCCAHQRPKGRKKKQVLFVGLLPESLLAPLPTWSTKICSHCCNPVRVSTERVNTGAELFLLWGLPSCSSALAE